MCSMLRVDACMPSLVILLGVGLQSQYCTIVLQQSVFWSPDYLRLLVNGPSRQQPMIVPKTTRTVCSESAKSYCKRGIITRKISIFNIMSWGPMYSMAEWAGQHEIRRLLRPNSCKSLWLDKSLTILTSLHNACVTGLWGPRADTITKILSKKERKRGRQQFVYRGSK